MQYDRLGESLPELAHLARANQLISAADFDVIHDHTTIGPLVAGRRAVPTVATVHGNPVGEYGAVLSDTDHGVGLVAISHAQRRANPGLPWVGTVHNALNSRDVPAKRGPRAGPGALAGPVQPGQGPRHGDPGLPGGRPAAHPGRQVQRARRAPLLRRGGPADAGRRHQPVIMNADREATLRLLVDARCLIMPIQWEEPFGMVDGGGHGDRHTGGGAAPGARCRRWCVDGGDRAGPRPCRGAPRALREVVRLDPAACITHVADNFSTERMARGDQAIYRAVALGVAPPVRRPVPLHTR